MLSPMAELENPSGAENQHAKLLCFQLCMRQKFDSLTQTRGFFLEWTAINFKIV